jgi:microcin C transport system permease protein
MGIYILRRLLMMIPTVIGITFLIFMLVALAPGGIGAALRASGGTVDAGGGAARAEAEAYLEDRYGLDDIAPVQYLRWLGRISPVKFGARDTRLPDGEIVSGPRALKEPPVWSWFAGSIAEPNPSPVIDESRRVTRDDPVEKRDRVYREASQNYAKARLEYVGARAQFIRQLGQYAEAIDRADLVDYKDNADVDALAELTPDKSSPAFATLRPHAESLIELYAKAQRSRDSLRAVLNADLFERAGVPIIPGVIGLGSPDLGQSFSSGQRVSDMISRALPVTLTLNLIALPLIYIIAIPCGMLSAIRKAQWPDVLIGSVVVALWSVPTVWAGVLAIGYLADNRYLGWFPVAGLHDNTSDVMRFLPSFDADGLWQRGYLLDMFWHAALPVLCLVYGGFAVLAKQTRAAMLENFSADFVRTAKAKGVADRSIVVQHVLRNSLLPLITMFASIFPAMLSGSVVIERIFSVPGMGSMILESIVLRDREVLLANTLIIATVNIMALLLADILYALADPRIAYK